MTIEILIAAGIALSAAYLLYKSIKKSASGKCTSCKDVPMGSCGCPGCSTDKKE